MSGKRNRYPKAVRKTIAEAKRLGLRVEVGRSHIKVYDADGALVTVLSSGGVDYPDRRNYSLLRIREAAKKGDPAS